MSRYAQGKSKGVLVAQSSLIKAFSYDHCLETIHVAVCFDEHMAMPFLALAASLRHTKKDKSRKLILHAIHMGRLPDIVARLEDYNTESFVVKFYQVDHCFDDLPKIPYISAATYLRLIVPKVLASVNRVLYLDADTIVVNDITELYDTDLKDKCLGAVIDRGTTLINVQLGLKLDRDCGPNRESGYEIDTYMRDVIGLCPGNERKYFNAGVLLIDLDLWRTMGVSEATFDYLQKRPDCIYLDQDALNAVIRGQYIPVDDRWNCLAICSYDYHLSNGSRESKKIVHQWRTDPWIVHYAGPNKPWRADRGSTPLDNYFWDAARKSFAYPLLKKAHYASSPPKADYRETRKFIPTRTERMVEYCSSLVRRSPL
jgi:lipopolysaccharide biosynthesis glycosyltransferase